MQMSLRNTRMRKTLRVETFLNEMNQAMPWKQLVATMSPFYRTGDGGRRAYPLEQMLRIHCLQLWHNLSDPAMEEALYDRYSFQRFVGLDGFTDRVPDETAILRFRHLLETHGLETLILKTVNDYLAEKGLVFKAGTIMDATLLQAPVSKKNKDQQRDPDMSSTQKNNKWHFGAKGHIGVQAQGKPIIHSTHFTTAKRGDGPQKAHLLHGEEQAIYGDSAYCKRVEKRAAKDKGVYYGISDKGSRNHPLSSSQKKRNRKHSKIRAKVEHPFRVIKVLWGQAKLRYKGLAKNASRFTVLCALSNVYFCRKPLLALG